MAKKDYEQKNPDKAFKEDRYPNDYWQHWLSRQMSDHYSIWFEINTDSSVRYLESASKKL